MQELIGLLLTHALRPGLSLRPDKDALNGQGSSEDGENRSDQFCEEVVPGTIIAIQEDIFEVVEEQVTHVI